MAIAARTRRLVLFSLGFLAAIGVEAVRADEAFLCEGGRIVKVPAGSLESMKQTDPCIAAHFGLALKTEQRLETGALAPRETLPTHLLPAPVVVEGYRPKRAMRPSPMSTELLPRTAEGTDFRNVVLLNPEPGQPAIYRHER
jgi:hypothetical protein